MMNPWSREGLMAFETGFVAFPPPVCVFLLKYCSLSRIKSGVQLRRGQVVMGSPRDEKGELPESSARFEARLGLESSPCLALERARRARKEAKAMQQKASCRRLAIKPTDRLNFRFLCASNLARPIIFLKNTFRRYST